MGGIQVSPSAQPQPTRPHHPLHGHTTPALRGQRSPLNATHSLGATGLGARTLEETQAHSCPNAERHTSSLTPKVSFMSDYMKCVSQHHNPDSPSTQVGYLFSSIIFSISSEVTFLKASDGLCRASYSTGERTSYKSRKTQPKWKHQLARSCGNSLILETGKQAEKE